MLEVNSELAALVRSLWLVIKLCDCTNYLQKWSQTNTGILQLCPNVVHVELRGSELCEFDALLSVLKEKSLVLFSISSWYLPHRKSDQIFRFSKIFDVMKNWPTLRSIHVESFLEDADHPSLDIYRTCSNLREISITGMSTSPITLKSLREMCSSGITKLSIWADPNVTQALCKCLHTWSATLTHFRVELFNMRYCSVLRLSLMEAISILTELRVMELNASVGEALDYGFISNLPRLEQLYSFHYDTKYEEFIQKLSALVADLTKIPSLTYLGGSNYFINIIQALSQFHNICCRREIQIGPRLCEVFL